MEPVRAGLSAALAETGRPVRQREHTIIRLSIPEINRFAAFIFMTMPFRCAARHQKG